MHEVVTFPPHCFSFINYYMFVFCTMKYITMPSIKIVVYIYRHCNFRFFLKQKNMLFDMIEGYIHVCKKEI